MGAPAIASGEDLDSFQGRIREACSALRAGDTVAGSLSVAIRTGLPDRPATIEQKAHVSRQTEEEHKDRPGDLLAPGKAERATPPPGHDGQDDDRARTAIMTRP